MTSLEVYYPWYYTAVWVMDGGPEKIIKKKPLFWRSFSSKKIQINLFIPWDDENDIIICSGNNIPQLGLFFPGERQGPVRRQYRIKLIFPGWPLQ